MKKITLSLVALLSFSGIAAAQPSEPGAEMQEAMKALGMMFGGGGGAATNQVIHQRQLRDLLPAEFSGMKRSSTEAGKQAAFGMNVSYAQATYAQGDARIEAKISDISAMGEFMKMAQYAWAQTEMERESDDGYERTTRIDGHPAQESFENTGKTGHVQVMVDGRFIVEIDGSGFDMETIRELITAIDLKKLAGLQPEEPN